MAGGPDGPGFGRIRSSTNPPLPVVPTPAPFSQTPAPVTVPPINVPPINVPPINVSVPAITPVGAGAAAGGSGSTIVPPTSQAVQPTPLPFPTAAGGTG